MPVAAAARMVQARQSRRLIAYQVMPTRAGMKLHHRTGVPSSRISEAQLAAPHGPASDQKYATGRPNSSHCHGQDWYWCVAVNVVWNPYAWEWYSYRLRSAPSTGHSAWPWSRSQCRKVAWSSANQPDHEARYVASPITPNMNIQLASTLSRSVLHRRCRGTPAARCVLNSQTASSTMNSTMYHSALHFTASAQPARTAAAIRHHGRPKSGCRLAGRSEE